MRSRAESGASHFYITSGKRGAGPMVCGGTSSADRQRHELRVPNCGGIRHRALDANQARSRRGPVQCQTTFGPGILG
ncbi:hypothetical protein DFP91_3724 [Pseudorhodoplanes sinuspersici]|nr:hypothetical protein DFP91_3724 [Pseudorhodoplanes sinuspersici]